MALEQVSDRCIASQGSCLMQTVVRLMGLKVGNIHRLKDCGIVTSAAPRIMEATHQLLGGWKELFAFKFDGNIGTKQTIDQLAKIIVPPH